MRNAIGPLLRRLLPIRYRDFYDVPRAIVVEYRGALYLLDSLFDPDINAYETVYTVYRLPDELRERIDDMSWTDLGHRGTRLGSIEVGAVGFDDSRRKAIDEKVFVALGLP
jgi:hypothetical protein